MKKNFWKSLIASIFLAGVAFFIFFPEWKVAPISDYHYLVFFGGEPKEGEAPFALEIVSRGGHTLVLPGKWNEGRTWCSFCAGPLSEGGVFRWERSYPVFSNGEGMCIIKKSVRPYVWDDWVYYEISNLLRYERVGPAPPEATGFTKTEAQRLPAKLYIPVRRPVEQNSFNRPAF